MMPCPTLAIPLRVALISALQVAEEVSRLPRANRFRNRSRGSTRRHTVQRRTPIDSESGGTQIETVTTTRGQRNRTVERRTPISTGGSQVETTSETEGSSNSRKPLRQYSPTRVGDRSAGVGLLEAEFLGSLFLLILLLFADTNKSYADKIMSTMKRGTMLCILFFVLALIAG